MRKLTTVLSALLKLKHELTEQGWSDIAYCPKDGTVFEVIEFGSTGVHKCWYEGKWPNGRFWVRDEQAQDDFPSRPIMFRPIHLRTEAPPAVKLDYELCISVRQPWAWLLVNGYKTCENRSWKTKVRGDVLIHAGQTFDQRGFLSVKRMFPEIPMPDHKTKFDMGGVVGRVEIYDVLDSTDDPWFINENDNKAWMVRNSEALPFTPYKGQLGFFRVTTI